MTRYLFLLLLPATLFADLNDDLNSFFNRMGASSNVSSAEVYNGQKAGYLTGGSLSVRNRSSDVKPLTIRLPKFNAGCGGIDLYTGGFSYVNDQQFIELLKNIGSNSIGYAFHLGIEKVSPLISSQLKSIQEKVNWANSLNINSCEVSRSLLDGMMSKMETAEKENCQQEARERGYASDGVAARKQCGNEKNIDHMISEKGKRYPDHITPANFNVAWEAIKKIDFLREDQQLAEFFMTLLGTVVFRKDEGHQVPKIYPSKIDNENFLHSMIEGGKVPVYTCDETKRCLVLNSNNIQLSSTSSWLGKIQSMLLSIQNKILDDKELSSSEREFVSMSTLPIYKVVNALTAYKKGACPVDLYKISEIISMDLLLQYLREVVKYTKDAVRILRNSADYPDALNEYLMSLRDIEEKISYYEIRSKNMLDQEFQLLQKVMLIEESIRAEITL